MIKPKATEIKPKKRVFMKKINTNRMLYAAFFAALTAVSAWISIPTPIPFTLQTLTVFLALMTLGGSLGTLSVVIYVSLGILGLPVFSGFGAGLGYLFGAGGGYIIGFIIAALLYALLERICGSNDKISLVYSFVCLAVIYTFGSLWFSFVFAKENSFFAALFTTALPFLLPDAIKIFVAYGISKRLKRFVERENKLKKQTSHSIQNTSKE